MRIKIENDLELSFTSLNYNTIILYNLTLSLKKYYVILNAQEQFHILP